MYWNYGLEKHHVMHGVGLTLTWDVLKCFLCLNDILAVNRLTLTWDVLK